MFTESHKVSTALDYASGSADRNGAILDMKGFQSVAVIVKFAVIAASAVTKVKLQSGAAANMSDAADLALTSMAVVDDADNQVFILDATKIAERYVRLAIDKDAANATAEEAVYIQYDARTEPVTQAVTGFVTYEGHVSPAEGTA